MGTLENDVAQAIMGIYAEARNEDLFTAHDRTREAFLTVLKELGYYTPLEDTYDRLLRVYKKTENLEVKEALYEELTVLKNALGIVRRHSNEEGRDSDGRRYLKDPE